MGDRSRLARLRYGPPIPPVLAVMLLPAAAARAQGLPGSPAAAASLQGPADGGSDVARAERLGEEGARLFRSGSYLDAAPRYREAFRLDPQWEYAWNAARALEEAKALDQAVHAFEEALAAPQLPQEKKVEGERRLEPPWAGRSRRLRAGSAPGLRAADPAHGW